MSSKRESKSEFVQFGSARGWAGKLAEKALIEAFAGSDPTSLHFAKPDDAAQRRFWRVYIRTHCTSAQPRLNFVTPGGEAAIVANILPQNKMSWLAEQKLALGMFMAVPRQKIRSLILYARYLEAKQREQVKERGSILYIVTVGARPAAQGRGLGSRLLRRVLDYADVHNMHSYLEASTPRSRELYLRHGFVDVGKWDEGFPVFLMSRPPAAAGDAAATNATGSSDAAGHAAVVPQEAAAPKPVAADAVTSDSTQPTAALDGA